MADSAEKSFEIHTARNYLDELLRPAYEDFTKDALSNRKAIACVIFAWHLHDWVWAQYKTELQVNLGLKTKADYDHYLFAECPELVVLQDLANGAKHFKSNRSTVAGTKLGSQFCFGPPCSYPIALDRKC